MTGSEGKIQARRAKRHLVNSSEFKHVYAKGKRFDGRFVTVYVCLNRSEFHRLGITASRKAIGNAVERNRAKRLLREAFRLNSNALDAIGEKYDWVLNARRYLLRTKVSGPFEELGAVISRLAAEESSKLPESEVS